MVNKLFAPYRHNSVVRQAARQPLTDEIVLQSQRFFDMDYDKCGKLKQVSIDKKHCIVLFSELKQ